ncbi:pentapeptide repeat-containing protein [Actinomycetospora sp. CA-101289]|uniref:pentapeptide repeat-containing protein n=1 Tax=Actinomycetospora sp. CA-101289 TaxID=3239893 RepID=UPI003D974F15
MSEEPRLTSRGYDEGQAPERITPITNLQIFAAACLVVAVIAVLLIVLLKIANTPIPPPIPGAPVAPSAANQIDAIRTALTAGAGAGGALALLLAFRRQRHAENVALENRYSAEQTIGQRRDEAKDQAADARQRRIADSFTKAADLLGSDRGPVRLASLHALEQLGVVEPSQRQAVASIIESYLRMSPDIYDDDLRRAEEGYVRMSAMDILRRCSGESPWLSRPIDLSGASLVGADFSGINLAKARLVGVDLSKSNLRGANLSGAVLTGATLDGANLMKVDLSDAWLNEVRGESVRFDGAILREARFWRSVLPGAQLLGCAFDRHTSFNEAHLQGATFGEGVNLDDVSFYHANLLGATMKRVCARRANFANATLSSAYLNHSIFEGAYLISATMHSGELINANLRNVEADGADFSGTHFGGADLTGANLEEADLRSAKFRGSTMTGTVVIDANLMGADLRDVEGLIDGQLSPRQVAVSVGDPPESTLPGQAEEEEGQEGE